MRATAFGLALLGCVSASTLAHAQGPTHPHILQQPAISHDLIAFSYAGDIWTVPRAGGRATRLTTGVGIESAPIFSPDGRTIAFTGEYDGNTDVFTIPATGGVPHRVTYPSGGRTRRWRGRRTASRSSSAPAAPPPAATPSSSRSRPTGGVAKPLPLPDGLRRQDVAGRRRGSPTTRWPRPSPSTSPTTSAWGNYKGGRAGTVWITTLPGLDSVEVPHETGGRLLAGVAGRQGLLPVRRARARSASSAYDPATKAVAEVFHNTGPDIRTPVHRRPEPDLRPAGRALHAGARRRSRKLVQRRRDRRHAGRARPHPQRRRRGGATSRVSPTGLRAVVEAHGEILTVPAKRGADPQHHQHPGRRWSASRPGARTASRSPISPTRTASTPCTSPPRPARAQTAPRR